MVVLSRAIGGTGALLRIRSSDALVSLVCVLVAPIALCFAVEAVLVGVPLDECFLEAPACGTRRSQGLVAPDAHSRSA